MKLHLVSILLLISFCQHAAGAAPTFSGKDFDLQGFIDGEIKAGRKHIIVPPGRYRVTPQRTVHLSFKGLSDLEIIADGVEMVCTQTTQALSFEDCQNVHFKGLVIDYDPLPFTEARITALPPDKSWWEFQLIEGYPENQFEMRIELYNPATGELRRACPNLDREIKKLGPRRYKVVKRGYKFNPAEDNEQVGDILVTNNTSAPAGSSPHAVVNKNCTNMVLEDLTVFSSNCFGYLEVACDNTHYLRCHIDRRPLNSDFPKRGFPRMRSLDADCFHSIGAIKGPSLIGCSAKFAADDCVNIHGIYYLTSGCQGTEFRVLSEKPLNIQAGDPVEFLPYSGARPPDATAVKVTEAAPPTEEEKAFVKTHGFDTRIKGYLTSTTTKAYKITLDRATELPIGSLVCSARRVGNGFLVKDCDFGYNRSRGILIKASKGQVIGNKVRGTWMAAILVAPEYWWLEAASSSDLAIKDNVIEGCLGTAIDVQADGGVVAGGAAGKPLAAGAHSNIEITDDTVTNSPWPNISVASTANLKVTGNTLSTEASQSSLAPVARRWNWKSDKPSPIITINCEKTTIENNH